MGIFVYQKNCADIVGTLVPTIWHCNERGKFLNVNNMVH